jgi:hypothetical protein
VDSMYLPAIGSCRLETPVMDVSTCACSPLSIELSLALAQREQMYRAREWW